MGEEFGESAGDEIELARDALHDARVLIDSGGTDAGVLNRLYYAVFHAAQAALFSQGENPSSHGDVRRRFGQHLVLTGKASRDDGRLLGRLYDYVKDRRKASPSHGGDTRRKLESTIDRP